MKMRRRRRGANRVRPLPRVDAQWGPVGPYPEIVRIPMDNGRVIRYRIDVPLPAPRFVSFEETCTVGYRFRMGEERSSEYE